MSNRSISFELTPLDENDSDRKELTCLWCSFRNCDYTFTLRGAAKGSHTLQVYGVHIVCVDKHEQIIEKERLTKDTLEECVKCGHLVLPGVKLCEFCGD
jgi:hypothetical protein